MKQEENGEHAGHNTTNRISINIVKTETVLTVYKDEARTYSKHENSREESDEPTVALQSRAHILAVSTTPLVQPVADSEERECSKYLVEPTYVKPQHLETGNVEHKDGNQEKRYG